MNPFRALIHLLEHERERWPLWVPVFIGVGIIGYFNLPIEPSLSWLGATLILGGMVWWQRSSFPGRQVFSVLLLIAIGFNAAQVETWLNQAPMIDREIGPAPVTGILMLTEAMPDGVRLTLRHPVFDRLLAEQTPLQVRIRMKNLDIEHVPPPGALIRLVAQVGATSEPVAPGAYDFRRQGFFQEMGGTGWSRSAIEVVDPAPSLSIIESFLLLFERARRALTLHVYHALDDHDQAAMTAALLNGEQSSIAKPIMQDMRVSGLSHLLSISGVHVSMMGLLVYFPVRALLALFPWVALRFPIKKWAAIIAIVATALYTLLVGPQAPTLRSAFSTAILMAAILVDRRTMSMRLLALAASIVMLLQPDGVMGPSFQMSFAAVLCMVAYYEKSLDATLARGEALNLSAWARFMRHHVSAIVVTSLVATAATTPFTLYHFQTFSFYGVVANMVAVPLTSFWIMPCILLAYLTAPLGWDALFIKGAGLGVAVIIALAHKVAAWPLALLHMPAMPPVALLLIAVGGLWLCLWRCRWRYAGLLLIVAGAAYPAYTITPQVLIADDGKEWAARLDDGRLVVSNLDRDAFVTSQWQQRLGFPVMIDVDELPATEKQVQCDGAGCVYHQGNMTLALPTLDAALVEDCARADVIVTPVVVRHCDAAMAIDDYALWHHGAHALSFHQGQMQAAIVREKRGMRPWSPGWKKRGTVQQSRAFD